ncbi:hypothetical protein RF11_10307 [Thelohanellus kitauei]|uniref:Alpha-soluble NSF attachment protein n=1 Tax=Thelohanellus kitauei TaxID=669202 RepID=A0A0C2J9H5_THEKT|nr:hypothetical protein RF11_10307 [Thelohanellus kitauei]
MEIVGTDKQQMKDAIWEINRQTSKATNFESLKMFEVAGKAYYEIARLNEIDLNQYEEALKNYKKAAECYCKICPRSTMDCYEKIIDLLVQLDAIDWAVKRCFRFGYKCRSLFHDFEKMQEFYQRGQTLRYEHDRRHFCCIVNAEFRQYKYNMKKALNDYHQFIHNVDLPISYLDPVTGLCSICIEEYEKLKECFQYLQNPKIEN